MSSIWYDKKAIYTLGVESLKPTINWSLDIEFVPKDMICPVLKTDRLCEKEFLMYCVYDKSHRVSNKKYIDHLDKCRQNFIVASKKKGCPVEISKCSINPDHWGCTPEQYFHEYNCPDKCYLELEELYFEKTALFEKHYNFIIEHAKSLENASLDVINRNLLECDTLSDVTPFEYFGSLCQYLIILIKERPTKFQAEAKEDKKPKELFNQTKDEDAFGFRRRPVRYHRRLKYPKKKMPVIEEDPEAQLWEPDKKSDKRSYSWKENQYHLDPTLRIVPSGLTKEERKEWEKLTSERLMCEYGIFSEDEIRRFAKQ